MPPDRVRARLSDGESEIGAPVWDFFNAHPVVFVVSLALVLATIVYLVRLLVLNTGPDSEFRLGLAGLEYRRGGARARPRRSGLVKRAWNAIRLRRSAAGSPPAKEASDSEQQIASRSELDAATADRG